MKTIKIRKAALKDLIDDEALNKLPVPMPEPYVYMEKYKKWLPFSSILANAYRACEQEAYDYCYALHKGHTPQKIVIC